MKHTTLVAAIVISAVSALTASGQDKDRNPRKNKRANVTVEATAEASAAPTRAGRHTERRVTATPDPRPESTARPRRDRSRGSVTVDTGVNTDTSVNVNRNVNRNENRNENRNVNRNSTTNTTVTETQIGERVRTHRHNAPTYRGTTWYINRGPEFYATRQVIVYEGSHYYLDGGFLIPAIGYNGCGDSYPHGPIYVGLDFRF